ncbi:leucine-rich repeat domain-containing protein, partial [Candidatus Dependentiae bacterium]
IERKIKDFGKNNSDYIKKYIMNHCSHQRLTNNQVFVICIFFESLLDKRLIGYDELLILKKIVQKNKNFIENKLKDHFLFYFMLQIISANNKYLKIWNIVLNNIKKQQIELELGSLNINYRDLQIIIKIILLNNNLRTLNLALNHIKRLPPEIGKLYNLIHLDLTLNDLECLPCEIENLYKLKHLILGQNNFKIVPLCIWKLNKLELLILSFNKLKHLSKKIGIFKNLRLLSLQNNKLKKLPLSMRQLKNLEYININNNNDLPADLRGFYCNDKEKIKLWLDEKFKENHD